MSRQALSGSVGARACTLLLLAAALFVAAGNSVAATPPEGRAYELVSPPDKQGGIPNFPPVTAYGFFNFVTMTGAPINGEQVIWLSTAPFAGATSGLQMNYLSTRTATGWQTSQLSPDPTEPYPTGFNSFSQVVDAADDFSVRIISSIQKYDPLNQSGPNRRDLYLQDTDGDLTWLTRPADGGPSVSAASASYAGRDADASHVLFTTTEALVPAAVGQSGPSLYDRTGGQTVLVNVDSGGTPIGGCGAALGWGLAPATSIDRSKSTAVSEDGSRIYFTAPNRIAAGGPAACQVPRQLYLREGGTTVNVSASQRDVVDPGGTKNAAFQAATADGSKVYFLSSEALTNDAADGDGTQLLYEYDVDSGDLTLLTPNDVESPAVHGVASVAPDGSRIYLVASAALAPGATAGNVNMYEWSAGDFAFIGAFDSLTSASVVLGNDTARQLRTTSDGGKLLFASPTNMTAYDSGGFFAVYLYDAVGDELQCVSCPQDGSPAVGDALLTEDVLTTAFARQKYSRNLTEDGQRAFFQTPQRLVPKDDNGLIDVYEWEDGEVRLISGGHAIEPSFFIDSARNGQDVFFTTAERLVSQDVDGDGDIYVARAGGGFPPVPEPPGLCIDDQCQGQPTSPPSLPRAASDSDFGIGNATPSGEVTLAVRSISAKARRAFARTGKLTLRVRVGQAGVARAVARARVGKRKITVDRASATAKAAGVVRLRLRLSQAAQDRLASAGRLRVTIVVSFPGATARTATVVLVQPAHQQR